MRWEKINGHSFVVCIQLNPLGAFLFHLKQVMCTFIKNITPSFQALWGSGLFLNTSCWARGSACPDSPALPSSVCTQPRAKCSYALDKESLLDEGVCFIGDHIVVIMWRAAENQKAVLRNGHSRGTFQSWRLRTSREVPGGYVPPMLQTHPHV